MANPTATKSMIVSVKLDASQTKKGAEEINKEIGKIRGIGVNSFEKISEAAKKYGYVIEDTRKEQTKQLQAFRDEAAAIKKADAARDRLVTQLKLERIEITRGTTARKLREAQIKLGTGATMAQRREVRKLILEQERLNAAQSSGVGSLRALRGQAQNFGWQIQDIAVQLQAGTSLMVALSQQGSQLAAGFGPTGALIGAGIAVFGAALGAALPSIMGAKEETDKLADAIEFLNSVASDTDGIAHMSEEVLKLKQYSELAFEVQKELAKSKLRETQIETAKAIKEQSNSLADLINAMSLYSAAEKRVNSESLSKAREQAMFALVSASEQLEDATKAVVDQFELSAPAAKKLASELDNVVKVPSLENIKSFSEYVSHLAVTAEGPAKDALLKYAGEIIKLGSDLELAAQKAKAFLGEVAKPAKEEPTKDFTEANKDLIKSLKEANDTYGLGKFELRNYNRELLEGKLIAQGATSEQQTMALAEYDAVTRKMAAADMAKKLASQEVERSKAAQKAVKDLAKARELITDKTASLTLTIGGQSTDPADKAIALLLKNQSEIQALEREAAEAGVNIDEEARKMKLANAKRYSDQTLKIEEERALKSRELLVNSVSLARDVTGQLADVAEDGSKEQKILFGVTKAIAFAEAIVATNLAATKALGTGVTTSEMLTNSNLIKLQGYANAAVIAGSAIGAYDKGGMIPSGGLGIVSEIGDELVNGVLVKGPARVTSREETNNIMNQNKGGDVHLNISINAPNVTDQQGLISLLSSPKVTNVIYQQVSKAKRNQGVSF